MPEWIATETNTHQDHVIAHVVGATVFGYFIFDETAFLLLDIGFIWHIYLDGEMGLRPHPVAIAELETDDVTRTQLQNEVDATLQQRPTTSKSRLRELRTSTPIQSVDFFVRENSRRLIITCDQGNIVVETSLDTSEVSIMSNEPENQSELIATAEEEREFVRKRLANDLGREPTEEELNEWLREHTESY
jgi:hypothetical protein